MQPDLPPRRPSLRPTSPEKDTPSTTDRKDKDEAFDASQILKMRRHRAPRTYARKRQHAEALALLDARSATVSLETRNCGEGRVSLGTKAVPLPALSGRAEEDSYDAESSSDDDSDTHSSHRRRPTRKRPAGRRTSAKNEEDDEERAKLNEFLAQQKAFWDEVDDSSLVEEEEGD